MRAELTEAAVQAAVRAAVAEGLLPKAGFEDEIVANVGRVRRVLLAALPHVGWMSIGAVREPTQEAP
jgi:hypothetical protein